MKQVLNLGAGNRLVDLGPDWRVVQHDRTAHRPEIDVAHDLNRAPWPWGDEAFDLVIAWAVLEHLNLSLLEAMDEIWRVLRPGGRLQVKLPYWREEDAYNDPTHRYTVGRGVFDAFDPDTERGAAYTFYTPRKWRIIKAGLTTNGTCVVAELEKRA